MLRADGPLHQDRTADREARGVARSPEHHHSVAPAESVLQRQPDENAPDEEPYREAPEPVGISVAPVEEDEAGVLQRSLATTFSGFSRECPCGEDLGNNCAHYLSDALIDAGYDELDGGEGARYRKRNGRIVCKHGRPVRAKELRDWFADQASTTESGEPDDSRYWAVYQERSADGQGHVVLHHHTTDEGYDWAGTGDYPSWATKDHYRW